MLETLGTVFQQLPVGMDIFDKGFPTLVFDGTFQIFADFIVHFPVKPFFPIRLICGSRDGMNYLQSLSSIQAVAILLRLRQQWDYLLCIFPVDPGLDGIRAFLTGSEFQRRTHGNPQRGNFQHFLNFQLLFLYITVGIDPQEVSLTVFCCHTVFQIPGPAFIYFFFPYKLQTHHASFTG